MRFLITILYFISSCFLIDSAPLRNWTVLAGNSTAECTIMEKRFGNELPFWVLILLTIVLSAPCVFVSGCCAYICCVHFCSWFVFDMQEFVDETEEWAVDFVLDRTVQRYVDALHFVAGTKPTGEKAEEKIPDDDHEEEEEGEEKKPQLLDEMIEFRAGFRGELGLDEGSNAPSLPKLDFKSMKNFGKDTTVKSDNDMRQLLIKAANTLKKNKKLIKSGAKVASTTGKSAVNPSAFAAKLAIFIWKQQRKWRRQRRAERKVREAKFERGLRKHLKRSKKEEEAAQKEESA